MAPLENLYFFYKGGNSRVAIFDERQGKTDSEDVCSIRLNNLRDRLKVCTFWNWKCILSVVFVDKIYQLKPENQVKENEF